MALLMLRHSGFHGSPSEEVGHEYVVTFSGCGFSTVQSSPRARFLRHLTAIGRG